jgi:hypothetical protein
MQYFYSFALLLCLVTPAWSRPLVQPQAAPDAPHPPPPPPIVHVLPAEGFSTESVIELCAIFATILCCIVNLAWLSAWRRLRGRWGSPRPGTSEPVDTLSPSSTYAASSEDSKVAADDPRMRGVEMENLAKENEMSTMGDVDLRHDGSMARESV